MNKIITMALAAILLFALSACSGDKASISSGGNGPLAPLADKYIEMAANLQKSADLLNSIQDSSDKDAALKKAEKEGHELSAKNEALLDEAKSIAEQLKGKTIPCEASDATGLTTATCSIYGVKAGASSATVTLAFSVEPNTDQQLGCLFQNAAGETLAKLKTFTNGDGTIAVAYMFGTKSNGEKALVAAKIEKILLVSSQEFDAATLTSEQN